MDQKKEEWSEERHSILQLLETWRHDDLHKHDEKYKEIQAVKQVQIDHAEQINDLRDQIQNNESMLAHVCSTQEDIKNWLRPQKILVDFIDLSEKIARNIWHSKLIRIISSFGFVLWVITHGATWKEIVDVVKELRK